MGNSGKQWETVGNSGKQWETVGKFTLKHGGQWETVGKHPGRGERVKFVSETVERTRIR